MKVLIADDSQPIRHRLTERLSRIPDVQIAEAADTPEALRQMAAFMPDVAVLDIRMPGGGGIKALSEIKKQYPGTTVIIMTNYPYAQYRRKCFDAGADFFFDKSTEFEQAAETIIRLMRPGKVAEVAHRTAATQLVEAKEELEKLTQHQRDMSILSLLRKKEDSGADQAYTMWEKTFDAMPDLVAVFNTDHTIVRVNKAMADGLGRPAAELAGKKCFEYIHGTACPVAGCPHEAMLHDGKEHTCEIYSECLEIWFNVSVSPIYDKDKMVGAIHMARDITAIKQAELYKEIQREILEGLNERGELEESVRRVLEILKERAGLDAAGIRLKNGDDFPYFVQEGFSSDFLLKENTLVELGEDGWACRNKDGSIRLECTCGLVLSGRIDPSNPLFTKGGSCWTNDSAPLLSLPAEQDPRLHPRNECIHQGYASVALVPIRSGGKIVGLIQLNDRRKNRFSFDAIERLEFIGSHIGEALARKQAEMAIQESEQRYRQLFEAMQFGFSLNEIICDEKGVPCDYRFLEVNAAFEEMTGTKAENLIGRTVKEVLPETEEYWIKAVGRVALTGKPELIEEFSKALNRHYSVSAYSPREGQCAAIFTDVTEQKNAVAAVLRARDAAEADSLAKSRFLANISHELRTPLNAIIGFSEMLQFTELDEDQREQIQTIGTSGEMLLTLVTDLLDLAKINLGKIEVRNEELNIREIVRHAVAMLSLQAEKKGVALTGNVEDAVPEKITSDPDRLKQVLVNLLNNAIKFTEKGFVRLTVENQALPSGRRRIKFTVEDSGEGMSADTLKRIFKPFQMGDNSNTRAHGGSGLGLAISKNLVELMGGSIHAQSHKGEGAIFEFQIADLTGLSSRVTAGEIKEKWQGRSVCVWTDDPDDLHVAEGLLSLCDALPRYKEAIKQIQDGLIYDDPADAVLCNLDLPGLEERLLKFRAMRPDVPWIAFSNWNKPLEEWIERCFSAFIDRPLKPEQLYAALAKLQELKR
ncbi:MAG: ATP-binding protein [Kiritimatiellales bacterium]